MSQHQTISSGEAANRLAIRELIEAYAHCAERRDANGKISLFTADTHFVVCLRAKHPKPSEEGLFAEHLLYVDWLEERALS